MWLSLCCSNQSSVLFLFSVFFRVGFPLFPICWEVVRFATSISLLSGLSLNFIQVVSMEMSWVLMKRYLLSPILPCLPFFNSFIYILFQVCPTHWNMRLQTERVHHLSCCWCPSFSVYYVLTSNDSPLLNCLSDSVKNSVHLVENLSTGMQTAQIHLLMQSYLVNFKYNFQVICPIHILRCLCTEDNSIAIWCSFKCNRVKYDWTHLRWYSVFRPL
jgi:hypothetical protein